VGAVLGRADWEIAEVSAATNPECNLVLVGDTITPISGSWALKFDYSTACTKYVQIVLDSIIVGMVTDGTFTDLWQTAISSATSIDCSMASASATGVQSLTPASLAGVVFLWLIFMVLACALWAYEKARIVIAQFNEDAQQKVAIAPTKASADNDEDFSFNDVFGAGDAAFAGGKGGYTKPSAAAVAAAADDTDDSASRTQAALHALKINGRVAELRGKIDEHAALIAAKNYELFQFKQQLAQAKKLQALLGDEMADTLAPTSDGADGT
jgi:hypothetical protein